MPNFPNSQSNPAGAIPVYVTPGGGGLSINDVSQTVTALVPGGVEVLPENSGRRYLFITCVNGVDLWINMFGGNAEPNGLSCFLLSSGQTYESGQFVSPGAVFVYCASNADVTVVEF